MSVRKKCSRVGCVQQDQRCGHSWISELTIGGDRKPPVNIDEFAALRQGPTHVVSKRDAEQWEAKIRLVWLAGDDPRRPPVAPRVTTITIAAALANYQPWALERLKVHAPVESEIRHLAGYFGDRPITDLESEALAFEFMNATREGWRPAKHGRPQEPLEDGRGPVAVNRLLHRLRHFLNWARYQQVPLVTRTPFHPHGVVIHAAEETQRTRRLREGEEAALLAACDAIDTPGHYYAGEALKRRILVALTLGARGSELDRVTVADVDWQQCTVRLTRGKSAPRSLAFAADGPLAGLLAPRRFLKPPKAFVFGDADGVIVNTRSAWETVLLIAHGQLTPDGRGRTEAGAAAALATIDLHFHDLRRECATRWYQQLGHDLRQVQAWLGHADAKMTQRYLAVTDIDQQAAGMARRLGFQLGPIAEGER